MTEFHISGELFKQTQREFEHVKCRLFKLHRQIKQALTDFASRQTDLKHSFDTDHSFNTNNDNTLKILLIKLSIFQLFHVTANIDYFPQPSANLQTHINTHSPHTHWTDQLQQGSMCVYCLCYDGLRLCRAVGSTPKPTLPKLSSNSAVRSKRGHNYQQVKSSFKDDPKNQRVAFGQVLPWSLTLGDGH